MYILLLMKFPSGRRSWLATLCCMGGFPAMNPLLLFFYCFLFAYTLPHTNNNYQVSFKFNVQDG